MGRFGWHRSNRLFAGRCCRLNPITTARYLHLISPQFKPAKDIDPLDLARRPAQAVAPVKRQTSSIRMATLATPATLAQALRQHGAAYLAQHTLSTPQAKAWRAIVACRTAALGGQQLACDACGHSHWQYHSCRNRHCPPASE